MALNGVGEQVRRILASPIFSTSARISKFLSYVVDTVQSGRGGELKEYAIGVEVFERGPDFDPRVDPIVRVQAAKLRSKLTEYYANAGAGDPIVIRVPKGAYVPEIEERKAPQAAASPLQEQGRCRIAVLPFVNMSADAENEYFSDGLTEEVINRLAAVPGLQVVARTSAFRFKGINEDIRDVGAKLSAGTVLEGSVRKAADQVRVTAQLIDVESGYHLFSRTYQREYRDIFALQDELAMEVVKEIAPHQEPCRCLNISASTPNMDAYSLYLRGMHALGKGFVNLREELDLFQQAIRLEPNYAPAWAGLAYGYSLLGWFYRMPPDEAIRLSRAAAGRALEIDPDSAQGLSSLALSECLDDWNWASGEARFRRVMEKNPGLGLGDVFFAFCCLMPQMKLKEACAVMDRALEVDPFNPILYAAAIFIYARAGQYEKALGLEGLAMEVGPEYPPIFVSLGTATEWSGNREKAMEYYRKALSLAGGRAPLPASSLAHALALGGAKDEARAILKPLLEGPYLSGPDIARIYAGLRDEKECLRWLEHGVEKHDVHMCMAMIDRRFDWLRPHPKFQALMRRMNLAEVAAASGS